MREFHALFFDTHSGGGGRILALSGKLDRGISYKFNGAYLSILDVA